ncbi:hypothetical protein RHS01_03256 [Rhizoctonia solani]|uniref:Uncharacterized protein n=1 Tax=Rhizoctonia solani TaxID=456999 RepID=A0A8H7M8C0_9AGAM|nr:hypothetical protein RHS01_03256 [Rhizoctonia solani]
MGGLKGRILRNKLVWLVSPYVQYRFIELFCVDHLSDSLLATVTAPNATSKSKSIELHNPTIVVELNFTGRLSFKWNFVWEEHEFEWKKEECYILRKPDPPVLIAVTEPEKKNKKGIVQFLDYNLSRFDISDKKGLEVLLIASLLSFQDQSEEYRTRAAAAEATSGGLRAYQSTNAETSTPALPPKPGEALVVKLQSSHKHEPNEIVVGSEGAVDEYVQRVVQVAEETKRTRRRARYEEELHQFCDMRTNKPVGQKGQRSSNLMDLPKRIPMPELAPIAAPPKPSGSQKVPTIRRPSPPSSRGGQARPESLPQAIEIHLSEPPRPGGVSTNNPYNPYGRRQRAHSPTLDNVVPSPQRLQKPQSGRHPGGASPSIPYANSPHEGHPYNGLPGGASQSGPASPAPGTFGQHEPTKDSVLSFGSSLFGRFSTRK